MLLEMPTHAFEEAVIQNSKIQNLFIRYLKNTCFGVLESSWKWDKIYKELVILTTKISRPFWWILGLKNVLIDMWSNDQNEIMFFYFQL
jgi:hypothetical protein